MVYALDIASGAKVWEFDVSAAVGEPVVVSGGIVVLDRTIIVTTTNGAIVAIAGE
jgi:outer membrane protein assembly factor BamB